MKGSRFLQGLVVMAFGLLVMTAQGFAADKEDSAAKRTDIKKLLVLTGAGDMGKMMIGSMVDAYKRGIPDVPEEFWKKFTDSIAYDEVFDILMPPYETYFTHQEIKDILKFYEGATGKKFLEVMPKLFRETREPAMAWGDKKAQKLEEELKAKGYKIPGPPQPPMPVQAEPNKK